jgi:hypothetical protein
VPFSTSVWRRDTFVLTVLYSEVDVSGVGRIRSSNKSKLSTEGKPERKCYFRRGRAKHEYREGTSAGIRGLRKNSYWLLVALWRSNRTSLPQSRSATIASPHLRSIFRSYRNNTRRLNALPQGWLEASSGHFSFAPPRRECHSVHCPNPPLVSLGFAHSYLLHSPEPAK